VNSPTPHLWRHPNGTYYAVWSESGRSRRRSLGTDKHVPACARLKALEEELELGWGQALPDLTLGQAAEEWLQERSRRRYGLAGSTLAQYASFVARLQAARLGSLKPSRVTPREISRWLDDLERDLSPQGCRKRLGLLRMLFRWLIAQGYAARDPVAAVRAPTAPPHRHPATTEDEYSGLRRMALADLEAATCDLGHREAQLIADLLHLVWLSGLRSIEVYRLTWEDIDIEAATWRIRSPRNKGGDRVLPIHPELLPILRRRRLQGFPGPIPSQHTVRRIWRAWKRRHGIQLSLHSLRHGFVTRLARSGHQAAASYLVGHHSPAMTEHYTHLTAEDAREVLEGL